MKKIVFSCFLMVSIGNTNSIAQTFDNVYRKMFDKTKGYIDNLYVYGNSGPYFGDDYGDGYCYTMEAYLKMYEATADVTYLNDFVKSVNEVMKNRDDFRVGFPSKPYWTSDDRPFCNGPVTYQTGLILWPMAHYVYFSNKLYTGTLSTTPITSLTGNKTFDGVTVNTFSDFAAWLYAKMDVTITYYDQYYWINDIGYRQYADEPCSGNDLNKIETTDRQMDWGETMIYLALAFQNTNNPKQAGYFDKAQTIAYQQKVNNLEPQQTGSIPWYFWYEDGWSSPRSLYPDDITHGSTAVEFMYLCNKYKDLMKSSSASGCCPDGYFTDNDMVRLANNMIYKIYADPLKYHNDITGGCYFHACTTSVCSACDYNSAVMPFTARWMDLSNVQASYFYNNTSPLYQMISDYNTIYQETPGKLQIDENYPQILLALANSYYYQRTFCFLGRNSTAGGSHDDDWQGAAGGDFNNDGRKDELISVRNSDGGFYFYKITGNTASCSDYHGTIDYTNVGYKLEPSGSYVTGGVSTGVANSEWKGIATGHFSNDFAGDQIVTIRNFEGNIYVWRPINTNGIYSIAGMVSSTNAYCPNKNWAGITSADLDNDGISEIAAIRSDGNLFIWNVTKSGSNYNLTTMYQGNMGGTDWAAITAGDIDNDGVNEIVAVRNSDGFIFTWKFSKVGGQFNLVNTAYDNSYYANNNFWNGVMIADYNSDGKMEIVLHRNADGAFFTNYLLNGTLRSLAVDYFPVNQDMKVFATCTVGKGKKPVLVSFRNADGDILLHSLKYINPFHAPNHNLPVASSGGESEDDLPFELKIYPNPANELLTVEASQTMKPVDCAIININGQIVQKFGLSNWITQIDISSLSPGIYCLRTNYGAVIKTQKFIKE